MTALTPRRREVLHVVHDWIVRTGMCPTQAQVAALIGVKTCFVSHCINELVEAGFMRKTKGQHRSLEVVRLPAGGMTAAEWTWCVANPGRVRAMMSLDRATRTEVP